MNFIKSFNRASVSLPNNCNFIVRQWRNSDSFISATSGGRCKVSDLFINNKLNFLEKLSQPIVTDNKDVILWIPGLAHCKFEKTIKTKNYVWKNT